MWNHIINIHPSELLSIKTKQSRINELLKKKVFHNNFFKKNIDNLHFIPNNILTKFFKELTKYKNDYQQYLNYIYICVCVCVCVLYYASYCISLSVFIHIHRVTSQFKIMYQCIEIVGVFFFFLEKIQIKISS